MDCRCGAGLCRIRYADVPPDQILPFASGADQSLKKSAVATIPQDKKLI